MTHAREHHLRRSRLTLGQKAAKAEGWEKAINTAEPVLSKVEYDYLIVRNPYKEKAQ